MSDSSLSDWETGTLQRKEEKGQNFVLMELAWKHNYIWDRNFKIQQFDHKTLKFADYICGKGFHKFSILIGWRYVSI